MKRKIGYASLLILVSAVAWGLRTLYRGPLVYEAGLAYDNNYTLNTSNYGIQNLSATASYSSTTVTAQTFDNGTASTGSITVASLTGLAGSQASNYLTVLSTNGLSGATITIGGTNITESIHWYTQTSTAAVATSIKTAINTYAPQFTATVTAPTNRVTIVGTSSGTWANGQTLAVTGTSSVTANASTFTGGNDNAIVAINNFPLIQGSGSSKWAVGASTAATGNNIATLINANTDTSAIVTATAPVVCGLSNPCGVVNLTAKTVGTASNYALYTSSNAALALSAPVTSLNANGNASSAMTGGTDSDVTLNSATIYIPANPFWARATANGQASMTAMQVLYTTGSAVALGGLTNRTTYYVIPVDYNNIKLASSAANARAGTGITITSSSTQTTAATFTLSPLTIAGIPSFKWQVSNDGNLWQDFTTTASGVAISSVTMLSYTYGGTSTSWDFGAFGYQYIRLAVIAPTAGAINLLVTMNGKGD